MEMLKNRRVLLLYKALIPSAHLCGHCQLEHLALQEKIEYRHSSVGNASRSLLNWAEIVLLCRLDDAYERGLTQTLRKAGKTIIYVIDDDLQNVPAELSSGAYYARPDIQANIRSMIAMSDAVLSPSPVLLAKYVRSDQKSILLEEPAIDPAGYVPHDPNRPMKIGFAGSIDRSGDIESILRSALVRIWKEYGKKVEFVFFGGTPSCAAELGAQCIPYSNSYDAYRKTMNELQLDIGLAPMPDTEFHACKHYNKFIEYAAANTVGVFSAVSPYDRISTLFGWELLCDNSSDSWYATIKRLLDHPDELDVLKQRIALLADTTFSIPVIAHHLLHDLAGIPVNMQQKTIFVHSLLLCRCIALSKRFANGFKRYGMRGFVILMQRIGIKFQSIVPRQSKSHSRKDRELS